MIVDSFHYTGRRYQGQTYAFLVDDRVLRLRIEMRDTGCTVSEDFPDSHAEMTLNREGEGTYLLQLKEGYSLCFRTRTKEIIAEEERIFLAYVLCDEQTGTPLSFHEITIRGEK